MMKVEAAKNSDPRRYFSPMEANAIVPSLEYFFSEMARIQRGVKNLWRKALGFGVNLDDDGLLKGGGDDPIVVHLKRRIVELSDEYAHYMERVVSLGVIVEDIDHGIVRMYSWMDGDEVFLSWQYGETEVGYWHGVREDFIARRPLRIQSYTPADLDSLH